jgi:small-conductance mechanosensitive channel
MSCRTRIVFLILLSLLMLQPLLAQEDGESPPADTQATAAEGLENTDGTGQALAEATLTAKNFGLRVFWAVVVVIVAAQLSKLSIFVLERLSERSARRRLLFKRMIPITRLLFWGIALYLIVRGIFNVNAQGLLAAAAAIGVAVGFAAQDILKNIFGGLVIVADRPFQVGDYIAIGGTYGEVMSIGLRSTRIRTPDDNLVSVPNAQVVDSQVANANSGELDCQVVADIYLPGWVNEGAVRNIAYQAAASSQYAYLEKPISIIIKDEFEHAHVLHVCIKAYVLDARYQFLFASDITERARAALRKAGFLTPDFYSAVGNGGSLHANAGFAVEPTAAAGDTSQSTEARGAQT